MLKPTADKLIGVTLLCLSYVAAAGAGDTPFNFDEPLMQQRFDQLIAELRCLVCQNQSLADSNAELAQDLRQEVFRMLHENQSDDEILGYMVDRYGDFVLYRPPVKATTWLLWAGPVLMLLAGIAIVVRLRRSHTAAVATPLDKEQHEKLQHLKRTLSD